MQLTLLRETRKKHHEKKNSRGGWAAGWGEKEGRIGPKGMSHLQLKSEKRLKRHAGRKKGKREELSTM